MSGAGVKKHEAWVDVFRCLAIMGVWSEHWFQGMLDQGYSSAVAVIPAVLFRTGALVNLFFLLSGYGLTRYLNYDSPQFRWSTWFRRRVTQVLVPFWVAVIATYLVCNFIADNSPGHGITPISKTTVLANLLLIRNQVPIASSLNESFWFMPVIFGLYGLFPLLFGMLRKFGLLFFFVSTAVIHFTSIFVGFRFGWDGTHQSAISVYYLLPFALGMGLGQSISLGHVVIASFVDRRWLVVGVVLLGVSAWMSRQIPSGEVFNDTLTAAGGFLVLLPIYSWMIQPISWMEQLLARYGRTSYLFYLVHLPIVLFVQHIGPFADGHVSAGLLMMLWVGGFVTIMAFCTLLRSAYTSFTSSGPRLTVSRV